MTSRLWDKLVISAKSFPALYWDKFVKEKESGQKSIVTKFEFDA